VKIQRRSVIEYSGGDVSIEDLIADENVVITISHAGYIKRTNLTEYKTQNRGGVGQKSAGTRDQDFLEHVCCDKPSIYDVLYPKENVSGCVFMKYRKEVKQPKVERFKILLISRAMIRSKHLFVHKI
jgi:DNA gyrase/topoisomerase IV subunit A